MFDLCEGTDGAARDMSKAMALYEAAGRAGHDQALVCLGALQHQQGLYHKASTHMRQVEGRILDERGVWGQASIVDGACDDPDLLVRRG